MGKEHLLAKVKSQGNEILRTELLVIENTSETSIQREG